MELSITLGIALVFALSSIPAMQYYHTAVVAIGFVLVFESLMIWLYESPRYLFRKGQREKGRKVLTWLRGSKCSIANEISEIEEACSNEQPSLIEMMKSFGKRSLLTPLVLVLLLFFFQEVWTPVRY